MQTIRVNSSGLMFDEWCGRVDRILCDHCLDAKQAREIPFDWAERFSCNQDPTTAATDLACILLAN